MPKCNKRKLSKKEAASFINYIANNKGKILDKRKEKRYYHCSICNHWHTTSQDEGESTIPKDTELIFLDKWKELI